MLKGQTIFIFGIAKFDGPFESTSFTTAKYLAEDNDVYYIDYPYTLKDYFGEKDSSFEARKGAFLSREHCLIDTAFPRLKVLILPPLLSINFLPENKVYRVLLSINERLIYSRVMSVIKQRNISDYIFINSFNFHYPNLGKLLKPKLAVYHCVDPLIVDYDRRHGIQSESIIVKHADLIICTSRELYRQKLAQNDHTFFIPNAADISHSAKARNENLRVFDGLRDIATPIIGYFGNIERRIDFNILTKVVDRLPALSFVFAGPVVESYIPAEFKNKPNVHFIGRISYPDMPAVLKGFDVAIIPFKKDEVSATIFPLKLFEYLGSGKPVVALNFNDDLKEFTGDNVAYCSSPLEFEAALNDALSNDSAEKRNQRIKIAEENTWEHRLKEFSILVNQFLKYT